MRDLEFLTNDELFRLNVIIYKGAHHLITVKYFSRKTPIQKILIRKFVKQKLLGTEPTKRWGNKKETYMTEEELFAGIPEYKWDELSTKEKMFYQYNQFHGEFLRNKKHASTLLSGKFRQGLHYKNFKKFKRSIRRTFRMGPKRENLEFAS